MDDLISRQAAIATAISGRIRTLPTTEDGENWIRVEDVRESLLNLPSAQLDIVYCEDCKYKDDGIDENDIPFLKCLNGRSYGGTRINDYCSWGKRKEDE